MGLDASFWSGRRVLVTGHTGFKGSWLALWLAELGAEVTGLALDPPTEPSLFDEARLGEVVDDRRGDVRDGEAVAGTVEATRPEVLLHLAAQPLVRRSFEEPLMTYDVNALGTARVLDALRSSRGARVAVVVTSDKCYAPRPDGAACVEDDPLGGDDPYSSSKACAELVASAYRTSFPGGPAIATARAGNVIGGGDWAADRLVPDAMRAALAGEPLVVRNPSAIRPWQHVLGPLAGYLELAERLWDDRGAATAWNFGPDPGDDLPVATVADRLRDLWGGGFDWHVEGGGPAENPLLRIDSTKARTELGWEPRWALDDALRATVEWFRAWAGGEDARSTCARQLAAYEGGPDRA